VRELAQALVEVETLSRALDSPPRIAMVGGAAEMAAAQVLLGRLTAELGTRDLRVVASPAGLAAAELAISRHLNRTAALAGPTAGPLGSPPGNDRLIAAAGQARGQRPTMATAPDGSALRCYAAGRADAPVVAIVSACGMPVGLLRRWITGLSGRFRVLTWESRGLFGTLDEGFDRRGYDLPAQAGDLSVMLDAFGVD
jgi:3-oxoadipate enol-lactonase